MSPQEIELVAGLGMEAAKSGYPAFEAWVSATFPSAFTFLAWQLYRLFSGEMLLGALKARQRLLAPFTLEYLFARVPPPLPAERRAEVLVTFFPYRQDYAGLLAPVEEELQRRGVRVANLLPPEARDPGLPGVSLSLGSYADMRSYAFARRRWRELSGQVRRFADERSLSAQGRTTLTLLVQNHLWQEAAARAALAAERPRVVLGLHYMTDPGVRGAIDLHRRAGERVPVVLLQHGLFSGDWPTHDFHGADLVMLWGESSRSELARFPDAPHAVVVGNPRLGALEAHAPEPTFAVLYAGTNGDKEEGRKALHMALEALRGLPGVTLRVRPHPKESRAAYDEAVEMGLLARDQIDDAADPYDAVRGASVVLGTVSTLLPEAVALGVPAVLVADAAGDTWWSPRLLRASTPAQLREVVSGLVRDAAYRAETLGRERAVAEDAFGDPSHAAAAAADAVLELMERR